MEVRMALSPDEIFQRHQRQVHLDFHTSPLIPGVASEFDATEFAANLRPRPGQQRDRLRQVPPRHVLLPHGRTGPQHPALGGRDLLGEQIEALHREGIRAPIYTTVAWEEDAAARYPQWRQMLRSGVFADSSSPDPARANPGAWKYLNFLHPEYQDYIEAHLREICSRYGSAVDGFFLDIVSFHPDACWSDASLRFREVEGLTTDDDATQQRFLSAAQGAFARRFTQLLRNIAPAGCNRFL